MTPQASISIVIACYNGARYLRESIESTLAQTRAPCEIIVVDDGSSDDSAAIASSFPEVRLIQQANQGVSAARNRGIAEALGDFVVLHDADDRLLPRALEVGASLLEAAADCGFVFGANRGIHADGSWIDEGPRVLPRESGYAALLAGESLVPPSTAIFRRRVVLAVGGFRVGMSLSEDYELYLRIARRFPIRRHDEVVVEYRQHEGNASGASAWRSLRATLAVLDRQVEFVRDRPELYTALRRGRRHWKRIFGPSLAFEFARLLKRGELREAAIALLMSIRYHPQGLYGLLVFRLELLLGRR